MLPASNLKTSILLLGVQRIYEIRGQVIEHAGRKYLVGYHPAARRFGKEVAEKTAEDIQLLKRELQKC